MATAGYKKASEEDPAVELVGSEFWAAVQGGRDVRIGADQVAARVRTIIKPTLDSQAEQIRKLKLKIFLDL